MTVVIVVTVVSKLMQPIQQQKMQPLIKKKAFIVLLEREIWHIWQPMWCYQAVFCDSRDVFADFPRLFKGLM